MIQSKNELDEFYSSSDPWSYNENKDDTNRLNILLSELPNRDFDNVLDIGCGNGFITSKLPGKNILGVDISENAIKFAKEKNTNQNINYIQGSIFELNQKLNIKFDLIVITGVLYSQYIGKANNLIYLIIDNLLSQNGVLVSVHIDEWYNSQFPYLKLKQHYYNYREFTHNLEIYIK